MGRMKLLLLVVSGLAVAALIGWPSSSNPTIPAPLQLAPAASPAKSNVVLTATRPTDDAAPAHARDTMKAVAGKAPARADRHDAPAAIIVESREIVPPSPAPHVNVPAARLMTYERRVADAATLAGQDSDGALVELQRLAGDEPGRPEAYEAMAGISLRKRDYGHAREQIGSALANGGKATFSLIHDHSRGNFDAGDTKATCVGELTILADEVRFEAREDGDRFSANWPDVRDAASNKFFGSGIGGFHVTITAGGKYKNFNLAPESKEKAEGKLILDLLSSYTRRSDRTK